MGTCADFYVGTGLNAEWLGSVAWDGYQWQKDPSCRLMSAKDENSFRAAVKEISAFRNDWTWPEHGWPWPWDDSLLTDKVYAFTDGKTKVFEFGEVPELDGVDQQVMASKWPNMANKKNVARSGPRSGIIILRRAGEDS